MNLKFLVGCYCCSILSLTLASILRGFYFLYKWKSQICTELYLFFLETLSPKYLQIAKKCLFTHLLIHWAHLPINHYVCLTPSCCCDVAYFKVNSSWFFPLVLPFLPIWYLSSSNILKTNVKWNKIVRCYRSSFHFGADFAQEGREAEERRGNLVMWYCLSGRSLLVLSRETNCLLFWVNEVGWLLRAFSLREPSSLPALT